MRLARQSSFAAVPKERIRLIPVPWLLISAFWLLIALASAVEMWLLRPDDVGGVLRFAATQWLPWVFLTPLIVWLSSVSLWNE